MQLVRPRSGSGEDVVHGGANGVAVLAEPMGAVEGSPCVDADDITGSVDDGSPAVAGTRAARQCSNHLERRDSLGRLVDGIRGSDDQVELPALDPGEAENGEDLSRVWAALGPLNRAVELGGVLVEAHDRDIRRRGGPDHGAASPSTPVRHDPRVPGRTWMQHIDSRCQRRRRDPGLPSTRAPSSDLNRVRSPTGRLRALT